MPRTARKKSSTGIYHIIMRGLNRQRIFYDDEDNQRFLYTLNKYKKISGYCIFAYCLMDNHLHLILKEEVEPLQRIMRRLCGSYVYWYNAKYVRSGNLFQDRFRSEPIEDDAYFLTVLRYIHQNPLKAGLVNDISHYRWSSYHEYLKPTQFIDADFALNLFYTDRQKAVEIFTIHQNKHKNDSCLELEESRRPTDQEARDIIRKVCDLGNANDLQRMDKHSRNSCLRKLKTEYNLSVRQIARLTGIGRGAVFKA